MGWYPKGQHVNTTYVSRSLLINFLITNANALLNGMYCEDVGWMPVFEDQVILKFQHLIVEAFANQRKYPIVTGAYVSFIQFVFLEAIVIESRKTRI